MNEGTLKKSPSIVLFLLYLSLSGNVLADAKLPSLADKKNPGLVGGAPPPHLAEVNKPGLASSVLCVDSAQVMKELTAAKDAENQIQKERKKFQEEIDKKEQTLRQENEKLMAEQKTLSPEAFAEKQKKFEKKLEQIKRLVETRRKQLESAYKQAFDEINRKFLRVVHEIAQKKGAKVVLQREALIWIADSSMEITKDVVAGLNKELPKIKVVFPSEKDVNDLEKEVNHLAPSSQKER